MKLVPGMPFVEGTLGNRHDGGPAAEKRPGMPYSPGGQPLEPFLNPTDFIDYMDLPETGAGNFSGFTDDAVRAINAENAARLMSANTADTIAKSPIDLAQANGCYDSPDKGDVQYGNPNTGRRS